MRCNDCGVCIGPIGHRWWEGIVYEGCSGLPRSSGGHASALAGGTYTGIFKPDYYGSLYIDASATQMADRPACATRTYLHLVEAESDAVFKNKFAMILTAWLADKPLTMVGTGTCTSEVDEIISIVAPAAS